VTCSPSATTCHPLTCRRKCSSLFGAFPALLEGGGRSMEEEEEEEYVGDIDAEENGNPENLSL
jgi:hypothetical protein